MAYIPRSSNIESSGVIPTQIKKKHSIRVFSFLTSIIFAVAISVTVGVFLYNKTVNAQLTDVKTKLTEVSKQSNQEKVNEIKNYDRKLTLAYSLLDNHIAPSKILEILEFSTKETVRFKTFEYEYDPGFEAMLTLGGDTRELESVALQKMQFLKDGIFTDFVVNNITTNLDINLNQEENSLADSLQTSTKNIKEDEVKSDLGVGFKVTGVFKKENIKYTGQQSEKVLIQDNGTDKVTPVVSEPEVNALPVENVESTDNSNEINTI